VTTSSGMRIIALEEHYIDPEIKPHLADAGRRHAAIMERLEDLGALRLREMDEAGIDVQVLSHAQPGAQWLGANLSITLAAAANDRLHAFAQGNPMRFAAFATLPTPDPQAAANELERCVKLGFKGAMLHGLAADQTFFDTRRYWPIFERAHALDVPVYMHPAKPHPAVIEAYLKDYVKEWPSLLTAGWGFTLETATQGIRLVVSGLFDAYPGLKIILGHLGEGLPFSLHRISESLSRDKDVSPHWFRDVFCEHVWITTSGNFSTPALLCSMLELGIDRILFSVDWPYGSNKAGTDWVAGLPLSTDDKRKLLHANAEKLLKL
jgi:predicted TIM-barrel fold metal-dependent hydrolase